jgi:hypothetical protein
MEVTKGLLIIGLLVEILVLFRLDPDRERAVLVTGRTL